MESKRWHTSNMGNKPQELVELAEEELKRVNAAYDDLKKTLQHQVNNIFSTKTTPKKPTISQKAKRTKVFIIPFFFLYEAGIVLSLIYFVSES